MAFEISKIFIKVFHVHKTFFVFRGGEQAKFQNFTVSRHILMSCSSETTKRKGVKVYIFWKLSSRLIKKLMFQDYGYKRHQSFILHDAMFIQTRTSVGLSDQYNSFL